ncbi:flagellar biosynthetic protein FliO [Rhizobium helianthi]|uniref:Flagellar biosynthetic protein FliO n=1 Tax=Rhizobium helianthi TaxID=1132695 RepID=A0ABW4LZW0_9HYPH
MTTYGSRLIIAVIGVGIGLLLLVVALYLIRRRNGPSPFLKGGRNRQPRLQVLDAAAVDARRRIVLIRRDNVEHLVMIGGPTDVVIESGIGAPRDGITMPLDEQQPERLPIPPAEPRLLSPEKQAQLAAPSVAAEPVLKTAPRPVEQVSPREPAVNQSLHPASQSKPAQAFEHLRPAKPEPAAADLPPVKPTPEPEISRAAPILSPATAAPLTASAAPDIGSASDALDAARRRVFQPAQDRSPLSPAVAAQAQARREPPAPAATASDQPADAARTKSVASEFDRILEEEMANNLAAQRDDIVPAAPSIPTPRRESAAPRVTGATPEPSLQTEIARIFGEMSVTKDDRQA